MKTIFPRLAFTLLAYGTVFSSNADDFRTFTDLEGRSIQARIVEHNPSSNKFLVERKNHKQAWIGTDALCEADRHYMQGWLDSAQIMSEESLSVCVEPKKGHSCPAGATEGKRRCKAPYHDIITITKLDNASIEGMHIEYRYFIFDKLANCTGKNLRQMMGEIAVGSVTDNDPIRLETSPVSLVSEYERSKTVDIFGSSYKEIKFRDDHVMGVWLKIKGSSKNGVPIVRDICIPEDLPEKVEWKAKNTLSANYLGAATAQTRP